MEPVSRALLSSETSYKGHNLSWAREIRKPATNSSKWLLIRKVILKLSAPVASVRRHCRSRETSSNPAAAPSDKLRIPPRQ
jgi:hypothetical protein